MKTTLPLNIHCVPIPHYVGMGHCEISPIQITYFCDFIGAASLWCLIWQQVISPHCDSALAPGTQVSSLCSRCISWNWISALQCPLSFDQLWIFEIISAAKRSSFGER